MNIKPENIPLCPKCERRLIHSWGYLWQCFDCRIKIDRRCLDCPNSDTLCNSTPIRCGFYKEKRRDWKGIRDKHVAERRENEKAHLIKDPYGELMRGSLFYRGNSHCNEEDIRG